MSDIFDFVLAATLVAFLGLVALFVRIYWKKKNKRLDYRSRHENIVPKSVPVVDAVTIPLGTRCAQDREAAAQLQQFLVGRKKVVANLLPSEVVDHASADVSDSEDPWAAAN